MAERKSFLLRVDQDLLLHLQRWADDDLRSLNGQIEFLLRKTLRDSGRVSRTTRPDPPPESPDTESDPNQG
ncbi:MAG: hypothetical protein E4G91_00400 [Candidatus Zixiibacteriota bacterium]|nr:MAG: hypothetical protein E4G91_00400 [candidate division Zixibacteria bacterium]